MIHIIPATTHLDFECISKLAHSIWHEHYISIISLEQIDYMLAKYNSVEAFKNQNNQGFLFFTILYEAVPVGYLGLKKEQDFLFVSKLYVLHGYRGKRIGKTAIHHAIEMATSFKLNTIKLHVNKQNTNSILAYEKMGFIKVKSMITDIGNGFVMDDFEMEKTINN